MKQSTGITMQIMSVLFYMFGMAFSESDLNLKQLKLQVDKLTDAVLILNNSVRITEETFLEKLAHFAEQLNAIRANQFNIRKSLLADWIEIPHHKIKLKVFPSKLNAYEAEDTCKSFAAKLLTINSTNFNMIVSDILRREVDRPAWIGPRTYFDVTEISGKQFAGSVSSVNTLNTPRYKNFDSTELEVGCVALSPDGIWLSRNCDETKHFICAIENLR
uniref:C-type lectin domain-containing protein n=1 Tax=Ascaris lumbricoides TaxID=6252 RepID=A0A0M3I6E6_ASCLU